MVFRSIDTVILKAEHKIITEMHFFLLSEVEVNNSGQS